MVWHATEDYLEHPQEPVAVFALLAPLAFVGKLLGYRARYPKYSGRDPSEGDDPEAGRHRMAMPVLLATVGLVLVAVLLLRRRFLEGEKRFPGWCVEFPPSELFYSQVMAPRECFCRATLKEIAPRPFIFFL